MSDPESIPVFPFTPDTIRKSRIWVLENSDFAFESDISELLAKLYDYPEDSFYLFCQADAQICPSLLGAIETELLRVTESQSRFYKHPKFKRDYVRLNEHTTRWEWEREVIANTPMYIRYELALSEKARRTFEMQQTVAMHQAANSNPLELKPNFMGIGVDLPKAYSWLQARLRRGKK